MAVYSSREISQSLLKKGFRSKETKHHTYYYFYYNNKGYPISTRLSRGSNIEYDDGLLSAIKRQLFFPSKKHLCDFIDYPLTENDYIDILKQFGKISSVS